MVPVAKLLKLANDYVFKRIFGYRRIKNEERVINIKIIVPFKFKNSKS